MSLDAGVMFWNPHNRMIYCSFLHKLFHRLRASCQVGELFFSFQFSSVFFKMPVILLCPNSSPPEKAMATHSSTLAWKIPWMEEPGRLQSMGSLGVRHDWAASLWLFTFMHWRRKWQPAPMFLPGESQGRGSLVGCRLWGRTESDTTEAT